MPTKPPRNTSQSVKVNYRSTGLKSHLLQRLMRVLHVGGDYTKTELAMSASTTERTLSHAILLLREVGLIHIARWSHAGGWSGLKAHYAFGPGPDAQKVAPEPKTGWRYSVVHARILLTLVRDMTSDEVATEIGAHPAYVAKMMRRMADEGPAQEIHIRQWLRNYEVGGGYTRIYAPGAQKNAERPEAMPSKKLNQRYRARLARDFGREVAARMHKSLAKGGIDTLVIDGKVAWQRRAKRGQGDKEQSAT